jgi:hypothetical protein
LYERIGLDADRRAISRPAVAQSGVTLPVPPPGS